MITWQILILLAAAFATTQDIVKKKVLNKEHTMEFISSRAVYSLVLFLIMVPFVDLSIGWDLFLWLYFISILMTIGLLYVNKSIKHMELSVVIPLTNLSPLFVLIVARIFLGESVTLIQFGGIMLLLTGAYLLDLNKKHPGVLGPFRHMLRSKYIHFLIGGLILFSFTASMDKYTLSNFLDPLTYTFYVGLFTSLNFIFLKIYRYGFNELIDNLGKYTFPTIVSAILGLGGHLLTMFAFALGPVSLVVPVKRMSTLFTTLIGGKLGHEGRLGHKLFSCVLMIAGAVIVSIF